MRGWLGPAAKDDDLYFECAVVLGAVTGVGGGVLRDVLLTRVPTILAKEIYALAAGVAASIQVVAEVYGWAIGVTPWIAAGVCFVIRFLAMRYSWGLPVFGAEDTATRSLQE